MQEASLNDRAKTIKDLRLHMVGKLQSNKAKDAVNIFDYIHSLDSQKLADVLDTTKNLNKSLNILYKCYNESQKFEFLSVN